MFIFYLILYLGFEFPFLNDHRISKGTILYIGKSDSSIKKRTINTHFKDQKTGSSTLRRSLGAILKDELNLDPITRSMKEKRFRDFAFINESEKMLTNWMTDNLSIAGIPLLPLGNPCLNNYTYQDYKIL